MSDYLFISPPQESAWRFSSDEFAAALQARWPHADVHPRSPEEPDGVDASLWLPPQSRALIFFHDDNNLVSVSSDLEAAIQVAAWFRRLAPDEHVLLLGDQGWNDHIELPPNASEADIYRMWDEPLLDRKVFGMLSEFAEREGHTRVPPDAAVDGIAYFGAWVAGVRWRYEQGWLSPEQCSRLESLPGWVRDQATG